MSLAPEILSPTDAAWFRMDTQRNPADIAVVMTFDAMLDEASLRRVLESRLLPNRRFRMRVVDDGLGPPRWQAEEGFSLDAHVFRARVAEPGDEAALATTVAALISEPFEPSRSPWRVYLLSGAGGGSVLVARLHHCMGDGFALLARLLALSDEELAQQSGPTPAGEGAPPLYARAARLVRDAGATARGLRNLLALPADASSRLRGTLSGQRRVAWSRPIPLATVKAIGRRQGVTVNDVIMAAVAGAVRGYLLEHGEEPRSLRSVVPVNLRPTAHPVAEVHGNWFGLVFVPLPTEVAERAERLEAIRREMTRLKASKEPLVALGILAALGRSPAVVGTVVRSLFARKATVVVSNVPGPQRVLSLAGREIRDLWFWVPHPSGLACGISILSYAGNLRIGVRTDSGVVPDPDRLVHALEHEISAWAEEGAGARACGSVAERA